MQSAKYIWMDGKFVQWNKATVHFLTHTMHYGSGIFEGIRAFETERGTAVFRLKDHINRLFFSAKALDIKIPYSAGQIRKACLEMVRKNRLKSGYIRPLVYLHGEMGIDPRPCRVSLGIAAWPWGAYLGKEGIENGIRCITAKQRRPCPQCMPVNQKVTGNYASSVIAKLEAGRAGAKEAVMLDMDGYIAECTGENIFAVKNGKLITPPLKSILSGITRDSIITIAKDNKITVKEKFFRKELLYGADEVFICGTAAEVTPVRQIDRKKITVGPVTKFLQQKYSDIARGRDKKYIKWLDFV